ncbi:hypothetical protein N473_26380 [Pseudoalteromonas luteoviolacea CPMOR-1]|uniref:Uncharacterized protein n=1 Tax=Pseudoalteromonas luteoviolacea CPMOR-1 TaxID=1365248 RepID=A0A167HU40_9GAMM|nr:hypothetical protein [Pseudoalteromonas luteoviolacea]KZN58531.1 hypothetical protein N473_26380 [Pseudoalteromonas luteoviolacea CPMOR-1]
MNLLSNALQKSYSAEEKLFLATSDKAIYEGKEVDAEVVERVRERGDAYSNFSREEIKTVRLLRSQCTPETRTPIIIGNETFHLSELYMKDEISITFIFT